MLFSEGNIIMLPKRNNTMLHFNNNTMLHIINITMLPKRNNTMLHIININRGIGESFMLLSRKQGKCCSHEKTKEVLPNTRKG